MYQDFCDQVLAYNSTDDIPLLLEILSCPGFNQEGLELVIKERDDLTPFLLAKKWMESIRGGLFDYNSEKRITDKGARDALRCLKIYFEEVKRDMKGKKKNS